MNEPKVKPVRAGVLCPKCGTQVSGYYAKDFGNEKATLVLYHGDCCTCTKEVSLLDAHQFEARSRFEFNFGRKW